MGRIVRPSLDPFGFKTHRPAPPTWLAALERNTAPQVWINGQGEVLPDRELVSYWSTPSTKVEAFANWIARGNVWVDYCGYPMFYLETLLGKDLYGETLFEQFLRAAGVSFVYSFFANVQGWDYPRSLVTNTPPNGFIANPFSAQSGNIYSSFALKVFSGLYIYAYADAERTIPGVYPTQVSPFIAQLMDNPATKPPVEPLPPYVPPDPITTLPPGAPPPVSTLPPTYGPPYNPNPTQPPTGESTVPLFLMGGLAAYLLTRKKG